MIKETTPLHNTVTIQMLYSAICRRRSEANPTTTPVSSMLCRVCGKILTGDVCPDVFMGLVSFEEHIKSPKSIEPKLFYIIAEADSSVRLLGYTTDPNVADFVMGSNQYAIKFVCSEELTIKDMRMKQILQKLTRSEAEFLGLDSSCLEQTIEKDTPPARIWNK